LFETVILLFEIANPRAYTGRAWFLIMNMETGGCNRLFWVCFCTEKALNHVSYFSSNIFVINCGVEINQRRANLEDKQ
jgi:hypothetical protein